MPRKILLLIVLGALSSAAHADTALRWSAPCRFTQADGSAYKPSVPDSTCDFLNTRDAKLLPGFSGLKPGQQQELLDKAAAAYSDFQSRKQALLDQTAPPASGEKVTPASLSKLQQARARLDSEGLKIAAPFAANQPAYVKDFYAREQELDQQISAQQKALGARDQAEGKKRASVFAPGGKAGALGGADAALNKSGADAQAVGNGLFDANGRSAGGPAANNGLPRVRAGSPEAPGALAEKETSTRGAITSEPANPAPGTEAPATVGARYRALCADKAAQAEQDGVDHLVAADKPDAAWYSRWYNKSAAAADAVKESAYQVVGGDSKAFKDSGQYWTQKGAALNADADKLDENGMSGAKKFVEKGASMGMLVTGHVVGNTPDYAQKSADFSDKLAHGDGDAWKTTGSAALHAPVAIVKGVYDSGKDAVVSWKEFGGMDSHTTTYNGLVATAKSVGFLSVFAVPAEGAVGTTAAKAGAAEVVEAAGKQAATQAARIAGRDAAITTAKTALKDSATEAAETESRQAAETLAKETAEKEAAAAAKKAVAEKAAAATKDEAPGAAKEVVRPAAAASPRPVAQDASAQVLKVRPSIQEEIRLNEIQKFSEMYKIPPDKVKAALEAHLHDGGDSLADLDRSLTGAPKDYQQNLWRKTLYSEDFYSKRLAHEVEKAPINVNRNTAATAKRLLQNDASYYRLNTQSGGQFVVDNQSLFRHAQPEELERIVNDGGLVPKALKGSRDDFGQVLREAGGAENLVKKRVLDNPQAKEWLYEFTEHPKAGGLGASVSTAGNIKLQIIPRPNQTFIDTGSMSVESWGRAERGWATIDAISADQIKIFGSGCENGCFLNTAEGRSLAKSLLNTR